MKPRFVGDANLNGGIISGLSRRNSAIDLIPSDSLGLRGLADDKVLAIAADSDRILLTHDHRTVPNYFADFLQTHSSSGVIVIHQGMSIVTAIDGLERVWEAYSHDDWMDRIAYLREMMRSLMY